MEKILFQYELNAATWVYLSSLIIIAIYFKFNRLWSMRNLDLLGLLALAPGVLLVEHHQLLRNIDYHPSVVQLGYGWLFAVGFALLIRLLIDPNMVRRPLLEPNLSTGGLGFMSGALLVFLCARILTDEPRPDPVPTAATEGVAAAPSSATDAEGNPAEPQRVRASQTQAYGPGHALIRYLATLPNELVIPAPEGLSKESRQIIVGRATTRTLAIFSLLGIVLGTALVAYLHFDNLRTGVAAAALFLLLPYTSFMCVRVEHLLPGAMLIWAVVLYRRPLLAGIAIGLACGAVYYPVFLLPLWIGFYWQRGVVRFLGGVLLVALLLAGWLALGASSLEMFLVRLREAVTWFAEPAAVATGFWEFNSLAYRMTVLTAFVALAGSFMLWPAQKNLGNLLSSSAAVMLGTQFWHAGQGGLYVSWYLPLLLLTVFRPNLENCVALRVLGEARLPKRWTAWKNQSRAA